MIQAFLYGAAALTGYVLLVALFPLHRCPRCKGAGIVPARRGFLPCLKCDGRKKAYRPGAPLAHRLLEEHIGPAVRDRIKAALEARRQS